MMGNRIDREERYHAHREDSPWHDVVAARIAALAEAKTPWAIPRPCIHEFLAIVTPSPDLRPPKPLRDAIDQVDAWLEAPSVHLLPESGGYWPDLRASLLDARATGPLVHDARVAALCRLHGIRELWAVDRDFGRFPSVAVRKPLGR